MFVGKFLKAKKPVRLVMKPLVEKAVHPLRGGISQSHAQIIIQRLEVSGLKTLEYILSPNDVRRYQLQLVAAAAGIRDLILIDDVKPGRGPCFGAVIPPSILVLQENAGPTFQR